MLPNISINLAELCKINRKCFLGFPVNFAKLGKVKGAYLGFIADVLDEDVVVLVQRRLHVLPGDAAVHKLGEDDGAAGTAAGHASSIHGPRQRQKAARGVAVVSGIGPLTVSM